MAVSREPNICPACGQLIKEIHLDQSDTPPMLRLIGDTFLRYEDHVCPPGTKSIFQHAPGTQEAIEEFMKQFK